MLFSHDTLTRPLFTTMQEANEYRRELTTQITEAATNGDVAALTSLLARYNALPLLICALVVKQATERAQAWQEGLTRKTERHGELRQQEQAAWAAYNAVKDNLLTDTRTLFTTAQRASATTAAAAQRLTALQSGLGYAQKMIQDAQAALARAVGNPNAGLTDADAVLRTLEEQRISFETLTAEPLRVGEIMVPAHLAAA